MHFFIERKACVVSNYSTGKAEKGLGKQGYGHSQLTRTYSVWVSRRAGGDASVFREGFLTVASAPLGQVRMNLAGESAVSSF